MASDVTNKSFPTPAPQAADVARAPSSAPAQKPAAPKPDAAPGRSFADELGRQASVAKDTVKDAARDARDAVPMKDAPQRGDQPGADDAGRPDADSPVKKTMQSLKKAAQSNKQDIENAPVLAFLTGHLEKLQPAQIPELVSGNEFLGEALTQTDLQAFMSTPVSLDDLVEALDLPPSILADAQKAGIDPSQALSPSDFLKAIGIDPQRVFAELKLLKDNLGTDGVSSYMARAVALAGKDPTAAPTQAAAKPSAPKAPQPQQASKPQVPGVVDPAKLAAGMAAPATVGPVTPGKVAPPAAPAKAGLARGDLAETAGELTPAALMMLAQPILARGAALPQQVAQDAQGAVAATVSGLDPILAKLQAVPADLAAVPDDVLAMIQNAGDLQQPAAPSMHKATFDAFATLGDQLRAVDTQSVDLTDAAPVAADAGKQATMPLAEQLLSRNMLKTQAPLDAAATAAAVVTPQTAMQRGFDPFAGLRGAATLPMSQMAAQQPQMSAEGRADVRVDEADAKGPINLMQGIGASGIAPIGERLTARGVVPVEDLRLSMPTLGDKPVVMADGAGERDEREGREESGAGSQQMAADKTFQDLLGAKHHVGHAGHAFAAHTATGDAGLTTQQRADMMQQVLDRATTLMREGGGTVRLDLASPELGSLEMAINMNNDRIDLKIMTGSDRVRDAMMADLTQLKSALAVQNVQLGQVDVGVGQRQHQPGGFSGFANNPGGGFQQQQQQHGGFAGNQGDRQAPPRPSLDAFQSIRRPIIPPMALGALGGGSYNGAGRIAVRA